MLVYAFDASDSSKQARAQEVISAGDWVVSTQVMQEFFVVATRRLAEPVDRGTALQALDGLARGPVVSIDADIVRSAAESSIRNQLSLWDALIVRAALQAGCDAILTEDLNHDQVIDGIPITNPFLT